LAAESGRNATVLLEVWQMNKSPVRWQHCEWKGDIWSDDDSGREIEALAKMRTDLRGRR
jgi:hypothetical protein